MQTEKQQYKEGSYGGYLFHSPTKRYSTVYVKSEDYGLEERAVPSNRRRLE